MPRWNGNDESAEELDVLGIPLSVEAVQSSHLAWDLAGFVKKAPSFITDTLWFSQLCPVNPGLIVIETTDTEELGIVLSGQRPRSCHSIFQTHQLLSFADVNSIAMLASSSSSKGSDQTQDCRFHDSRGP